MLSGRFADAEQLVEHIHTYLSAKRKEMDEGKIDRKLYVITKALSKMPHEYADAKAQAHVEVAARMIRELGKTVNAGMEIPYMMAIKKGEDGGTIVVLGRTSLKTWWTYSKVVKQHKAVPRETDSFAGGRCSMKLTVLY